MFTGLIQTIGRVTAARAAGQGRELEIEAPGLGTELAVGESVSVAGACQTATAVAGARFRCFVMGETLRATTLGHLRIGDAVNLERALRADGRLGGHFVTGHVDGVGRIEALVAESGWTRLVLSMAPELASQLVPKGSLAVDGVSLTLGPELAPGGCELFLIPHTLSSTTLGAAKPGDSVNLELDVLGKYVLAYLERGEAQDARLRRLLAAHGFAKGGTS